MVSASPVMLTGDGMEQLANELAGFRERRATLAGALATSCGHAASRRVATVPHLVPTCVWKASPELLLRLDERFGEPVDTYVNGSQVWLRDDGPGVPPEQRADLFEFGRTTKVGGSGIGLPLSQLIVESHGGALGYEEHNGVRAGATFRLSLPVEAS